MSNPPSLLAEAEIDIARLRTALDAAKGAREAWKLTAAQAHRDRDYYRSLVVEIGELFGEEARRADDGTIADDVLCAKVPGLVRALRAALDWQRCETHGSIKGGRAWGCPDCVAELRREVASLRAAAAEEGRR